MPSGRRSSFFLTAPPPDLEEDDTEADTGFLTSVTAKLWTGAYTDRLLLVNDRTLALLDARSSRPTHRWVLADVASVHRQDGLTISITRPTRQFSD